MKLDVKDKPKELCTCGHPKDKHRPRTWGCYKCGCKKFQTAESLKQPIEKNIAHPEDCRCAGCAWKRLEQVERLTEHLSARLDMVDKVVDMLEALSGKEIPSWISFDGDCIKPDDVICNLGIACDACPFNPDIDEITIDESAELPKSAVSIEEEKPVEEEQEKKTE